MKRLDFLYFDAGGGHRSAANALSLAIERSGRPWEIRLINLQEVMDPLDIFRKYFGLRLQDVYNLLLKKGWTLGSAQLLWGMHQLIRLYHPKQVRLLEGFWRGRDTDLVQRMGQEPVGRADAQVGPLGDHRHGPFKSPQRAERPP